MIFRFLSWVIITLFIGYALISLIWPKQRSLSDFLTRASLAGGLGFGISSCVFFLSLSLSSQLTKSLFLAEAILAGALLLLQLNKNSSRTVPQRFSTPSKQPFQKTNVLLWIAFCAILGSSVTIFISSSVIEPHGGYDGWEIWNMRARFLFRGDSQWTDGFSPLLNYSHPDYPLLVSASIARSWIYTGNETQTTPVALAMFFTFATVALLSSSLSFLRSTSQGVLAGLVLLGTPFFLVSGASQYADVPLGFYFLAALVLLHYSEQLPEANRSLLALAGTIVGLTTWTKNEGLLFLVAIIVSLFVLPGRFNGWKHSLKQMTPFLVGLMPVLIILAYFKTALAPANDLVSEQQGFWPAVGNLLTFSRYWEISKAFVAQLFYFGTWHPYTNTPIILIYYALLAGVNIDQRERPSVYASAVLLTLMLVGYFFTYVLTPRPVKWHLDTSLNRLFLQLWPSFLFIYFLIVRTPEVAIRARSGEI